jgi:hypothetical protein
MQDKIGRLVNYYNFLQKLTKDNIFNHTCMTSCMKKHYSLVFLYNYD